MSTLKYTETDFAALKQNLKDFLKTKPEFADYNFDGSALSVLIDLLAYNTSHMAFYANMIGNESFLDSAELRESVISKAKELGYNPKFSRSAKAKIQITFTVPGSPPASIFLDKGTKFYTVVDSVWCIFTVAEPQLIYPSPTDSTKFISNDIVLVDGEPLVYKWPVEDTSSTGVKQRFIVPNPTIDDTQLVVKVQKSATNEQEIVYYTRATDINTVESQDTVYYVQESDGKLEIYFGDNVLGKTPDVGNIIIAEYVASAGEKVNGAKTFAPLFGLQYTYQITLVEAASGATGPESNASIKLLAPANYEGQNRAVTKSDYETLIKRDFPQVEFVRVWGGEENDPPVYGKVYICLKTVSGTSLSEDQKAVVQDSIIRPRSVISLQSVLVEPEYIRAIVTTDVKYDSRRTTLLPDAIKNEVIGAIRNYKDTELIGFDSYLRYSRLCEAIDNADQAIKNNLTTLKMKYRIYPPINLPTRFEFSFKNPIDQGDSANNISSVSSSAFLIAGVQTYIGDDGKGNLYFYRVVANQKVIVTENIGTINYSTGMITLPALTINGFPGEVFYIDVIVTPALNDIIPVNNQIILIEDQDVTVTVVGER